MNSNETDKLRGNYRLSFIINTVAGSCCLLLAIVGTVLEAVFPVLHSSLAFAFLWPALICWFIASLHYTKQLSLQK